jgi:glycosyltransferase involved in cell wall biosynthesis
MKTYQGKISVIVPAYNEGSHIYDSLSETIETLDKLARDYEIVVVDDGSTDNTHAEAARASVNLDHIKIVRHEPNHGKGEALRYGFRFVSGDLVAFLDADLDLHPHQLQTLYEYLQDNDADVVIGSKRHPRSIVDYPPNRRLMSNIYYILVKTLFGLPVRDTQTGIKMFKIEVLKRVFPRIVVKRYAFDLEMLVNAHRLGYKIIEAPITLDFRRDFGRIKYRDARDIWIDTMAIFYRTYILRYYDKEHKEE